MKHQYNAAIVTGASSGIGAAIARKLCENGTTVYALARDLKALHAVRNELPKSCRTQFMPMKCDISDREVTLKTIAGIFSEAPIDLVIANAGVGHSKNFAEYTWSDIDAVIDTNLRGTINTIRASLASRKDKPLQIVCTTSLAGKIGFPKLSVYSATKFAIEGLVEALRYEYREDEVVFTVLRPGITATSFFSRAGMQDFEKSVKDLKSYYTPEKVAETFVGQLSRKSSIITVGNDKYFLRLLPVIPFKHRFKILDIINKL